MNKIVKLTVVLFLVCAIVAGCSTRWIMAWLKSPAG